MLGNTPWWLVGMSLLITKGKIVSVGRAASPDVRDSHRGSTLPLGLITSSRTLRRQQRLPTHFRLTLRLCAHHVLVECG